MLFSRAILNSRGTSHPPEDVMDTLMASVPLDSDTEYCICSKVIVSSENKNEYKVPNKD